jgi:hypothetical protein
VKVKRDSTGLGHRRSKHQLERCGCQTGARTLSSELFSPSPVMTEAGPPFPILAMPLFALIPVFYVRYWFISNLCSVHPQCIVPTSVLRNSAQHDEALQTDNRGANLSSHCGPASSTRADQAESSRPSNNRGRVQWLHCLLAVPRDGHPGPFIILSLRYVDRRFRPSSRTRELIDGRQES